MATVSPQTARLVRFLLAGIATAVLLAGPWSSPASANHVTYAQCVSSGYPYNTTMYQAGLGSARGIGAWDGGSSDGLWIADTDVHCVRVGSMFHKLDESNYVDIGWVDNPLGVHYDASCNATSQTSKPYGLFVVAINDYQTCGNIALYWSSAQWADFRVENAPPGTDEYFTFYVNGTQQAHRFTGYNTGSIARSNRRAPRDMGYSMGPPQGPSLHVVGGQLVPVDRIL